MVPTDTRFMTTVSKGRSSSSRLVMHSFLGKCDADDEGDGLDLVYAPLVICLKVATRWNTTVEGAMEVEKELRFDRSIYDELRARRDFGFEQVGNRFDSYSSPFGGASLWEYVLFSLRSSIVLHTSIYNRFNMVLARDFS